MIAFPKSFPLVALVVAGWMFCGPAAGILCAGFTPTAPAKTLAGPDSDGDGLPDIEEIRFGSDPFLADTDSDGANDLAEYLAGTNPRDPKSYPIFVETDRSRQLLTGDLLRLNPLILKPFNLLTNITYVTNDPTDPGGAPTITTNQDVSTNFTTFQWFHDGTPLSGETNSALVRFGIDRIRGGRYSLQAQLETSQQNGRGARIDVLGVRETRAIRQPAGDVLSWGREFGPVRTPIADANAISAGFVHAYAILSDGRLVGWGTNSAGQLDTPAGLGAVVSVGVGAVHTAVVRTNGQVVCWGNNQFGQSTVPPLPTNAVAVAAGHFHTLALLADGTVAAWGDNSSGQCDVPPGLSGVVAIAGGGSHSVALRADGTVVCWGGNALGQSTVPAGLPQIARIAAGGSHTLALTRTGRVVAWGDGSQKQTLVPPTLLPSIAIAAGPTYSIAATAAGRAVGWGLPVGASGAPATATNTVAIAAGFQAAYGIRQRPDVDGDGLDEAFERANGSNPFIADTDGDGLEDGIEVRLGFNPALADTDGNGISDFDEVLQSSDSDGDGLVDSEEIRLRLDPFNADTDGDGYNDGAEILAGTNPNNPASYPLFRLEARGRQLLAGDTLVLRAVDLNPASPQVVVTNVIPGTVITDPDTGETTTNAPVVVVVTNAPANPASRFQWFRGAAQVGGQTNASLVVVGVTTNDAGIYRLVATSGASTNTQSSTNLTVSVLPFGPLARPFRRSGTVVAWGDDTFRQSRPPAGLSNVIEVAGGLGHSVALRDDGTVVAWGSDIEGQSTVPADLTNAVSVAAGSLHTLALTADGRVLAWGDNSRGQCTVPTNLVNAVAIAAGALHSMALDGTGRVWAWGDTTSGQTALNGQTAARIFAGQLASGLIRPSGRLVVAGRPAQADVAGTAAFAPGADFHTVLFRNGAVQTLGSAAPTPPAGTTPSTAVAAGERFWSALRADGTVAVWGGAGLTVTNVPVRLRSVVGIAAGQRHMLAIVGDRDQDDDGLADARERVLGTDPNIVDSDADGIEDGIEIRIGTNPLSTDTDGDGLADLVEIRNGFDPLTGTEQPAGTVGIQPAVRLGFFTIGGAGYRLQGSEDGVSWVNIGDARTAPRGRWSIYETPVAGLGLFRLVSPLQLSLPAGSSSVLGTVVAWGNSEFDQTAVPFDLNNVSAVSAGTWHTLALLADGTVRGWGDNAAGQSTVPANLGRVVAVAAGGTHSLALLESGTVRGWGRNTSGQATPPSFNAPVTAIAAGGDFSLALLTDGRVVAWGADYNGQTEVPAGLAGVRSVAAGWSHAAAVRNDGTVVCWGHDNHGQSTVPAGLAGVVAVAAGDSHTVALLADGTVRAWGSSGEGQTTIPAGLDQVVAIRAGYNHTVALRRNGELVTWGGGSGGALKIPAGLESPSAFSAGGFHTVVVLQPRDTDGDGLDDRFETRIGTSPVLADTDGDGLSDFVELRFGFDPLQPAEAPEASLTVSPAVRLTLFTVGDATFRLESSANLVEWVQEGSLIQRQNGYSEQVLDAPDSVHFYRLLPLPAAQ